MVTEKQTRAFLKEHSSGSRAALIVLAAAMLAAPPVIIALAPGGYANWISWVERLTALYAFTFIFMDIVIGSNTPYFIAVFKPKPEYLIHMLTGSLGFVLALAHGLVVITQRSYRGVSAAWIIGPVMLILLVFTIYMGLDRARFKKTWRFVHVFNYAVFVGAYVKALLIGTDFALTTAYSDAVMILFTVYVFIAALALVARLRRYQVQVATRKRRAAEKAATEPGTA
jgi:hypothetical protein